jgi:uncharacterized protein (DUF927 family)
MEAAAKMFEVWMLSRDTHGHGDDENAIRQIRAFLELHGSSRFQDIDDEDARIHDRAGFKRKGADGETEYLILPEVFRSEVCEGHDACMVAKVLIERGYLTKGDGRNFSKRETVPEMGRIRTYVISRRIMDVP